MASPSSRSTIDPVDTHAAVPGRSKVFPWVVFALIFGLLLSDYMSRQVLGAVFPFLKSEWALSDSNLASLISIVALMVGLLTFPLSILADRWGKVRSLILMAVIWSVATLLCALASSYGQMLGARFLVGVGEAAYGSVGLALALSVFAPNLRATLSGTFRAGGSFGSVLGVALGGVIAVHLSWRWAFAAMAVFGLILVAVFRLVVTERRVARHRVEDPVALEGEPGFRAPLSSLFTTPSVILAYIGDGFQMFAPAVFLAWLPSYFNRYYHMAPDRAGVTASIFVLLIATGMIVCGILTDRISRVRAVRKWDTAVAFCLTACVVITVALQLAPGPAQLVLLGIGAFVSAGGSGAMVAMVANLTHPTIRSSAFGALTVVTNLLGLALGPFVVGVLADRWGLLAALQLAGLVYLPAVAALLLGRRCFPAGLSKLQALNLARSSGGGSE